MRYRQVTATVRAAVPDYGQTDEQFDQLAEALGQRAAEGMHDGVLTAGVGVETAHAPIPVPSCAASPKRYARSYVQAGVR